MQKYCQAKLANVGWQHSSFAKNILHHQFPSRHCAVEAIDSLSLGNSQCAGGARRETKQPRWSQKRCLPWCCVEALDRSRRKLDTPSRPGRHRARTPATGLWRLSPESLGRQANSMRLKDPLLTIGILQLRLEHPSACLVFACPLRPCSSASRQRRVFVLGMTRLKSGLHWLPEKLWRHCGQGNHFANDLFAKGLWADKELQLWPTRGQRREMLPCNAKMGSSGRRALPLFRLQVCWLNAAQ